MKQNPRPSRRYSIALGLAALTAVGTLALLLGRAGTTHPDAVHGTWIAIALLLLLAVSFLQPWIRDRLKTLRGQPPNHVAKPGFGEDLHPLILDSLADGVIAADMSGRIEFFSPMAEQITGWSRRSAVGSPLESVFRVVDGATGRRKDGLIQQLAQKGQLVGWLDGQSLLTRQGRSCPIAGSGRLIRNQHGIAVGLALNFRSWTMDQPDSERVGPPEQRKIPGADRPPEVGRTGLSLAKEPDTDAKVRLYAAVIDCTREGVLITDLDAHIIAVNRSYTEITGYREDEVIGRNPRIQQSGRHDPSFYQTMWSTLLDTGHWQGEIWNRRKSGEIYPEWQTISTVMDDTGQATHYVAVFTDISQRKESESRLERLAHYDPLTDLPNRLLLKSRLEHALERAQRRGSLVAVLFIDLDQFKTINDSLGHPTGDALLSDVAQRLASRLRQEDTLGRLGGDEFLVIVEDLADADDARVVAQNLLNTLDQPFTLPNEQEVYVRASIGISLFPNDGTNSADLIRNADAAMYQVKDSGRNAHGYYTRDLTEAAAERLKLETRLRHALEREEFVLYYQPIVSVVDNQLIGAEALIRWHPKGEEVVPPASFIGVAEETGLIVPLGEWVLRQTCRQAKAWLDAGSSFGHMALNLSVRQFHQRNLETVLAAILRETGLPAECLELEITESCLMKRGKQAEGSLRAIKAMGVRLSIDDFGTGYSSLAHLKSLPLDRLKIDCSFIRDIPTDGNETAIASTVIAMAHHLGLRAIAEGVETPAQLEFLRQQGCDAYQGFLFCPPLPPDQFAARFLLARA